MRIISWARPTPGAVSREAGLRDWLGGSISSTNDELPHSGQVHHLPPVEVNGEADDPRAVTSRGGSRVRRHVFIATRSREADALAARRKWRRRP
jgi:hypothetical protein